MTNGQRRVFKLLALLLSLVMLLGAFAPAEAKPADVPSAEASAVLGCDVAGLQAGLASAVIVVSAARKTAPVPHCRVDGYVVTPGVDGFPDNHVNFMLALPDVSNNRYYFIALGGSAGSIPQPPASLLAEGYAVAGTDTGNQSGGLDWRFMVDHTKAYDWANRGAHVSAVATQDITRNYYGLREKKDLYRYISGCSGGGKMGIKEAGAYPEDFDGVLAGAPGISRNTALFFGKLSDIILRDTSGWIEPAKLQQLEQAIVEKYDSSDGAIDGIVSDPSKIDPDFPASVGIFTDSQLKTIRYIISGVNLFGQTYPGYTLSNPSGLTATLLGKSHPDTTTPPWTPLPGVVSIWNTLNRGLFGLDYDVIKQFDWNSASDVNNFVAANVKAEGLASTSTQHQSPDPANLEKFRHAGGKMIIWHGVSDTAVSQGVSIDYYSQLAALQGGYDPTKNFVRLFLAPGVLHCGGGPGPQDVPAQALEALIQWVEHGNPPKDLIARSSTIAPQQRSFDPVRDAEPSTAAPQQRSFRLCPYPEVSVFAGGVDNPRGLDVNDATNWSCQWTDGTWVAEFQAAHGRAPTASDRADREWSLQFARQAGRSPTDRDWIDHYYQSRR